MAVRTESEREREEERKGERWWKEEGDELGQIKLVSKEHCERAWVSVCACLTRPANIMTTGTRQQQETTNRHETRHEARENCEQRTENWELWHDARRMQSKRRNCMQIMLDIVSAYFLACEPRQKLTFSPRRNTGSRQSRQQRGRCPSLPSLSQSLSLYFHLLLCLCVCVCVQPVETLWHFLARTAETCKTGKFIMSHGFSAAWRCQRHFLLVR